MSRTQRFHRHRERRRPTVAICLMLLCACDGTAALDPELRELRGPDENGNGLQDDVDAFIREHARSEDERRVLEMYAHSEQDGLEWSGDEARSLEIAHDEAPQMCLYVLWGLEEGEAIRSEIFALSVDSEARTRAYFKWESHLGGQFFPSVHFTLAECLAKAREGDT